MRRLAIMARDDVIEASLIAQQFSSSGSRMEMLPMLSEDTLSNAVEQHLAENFARFGDDLPPDGLYNRVIEQVERPLLQSTMAAVRGNQIRAAKLLGINRNTLRKKLTDLGIEPQKGR
jgi:two-component system, NtrC family, nitrogen regulation response regulator GlnG